MQTANLLAIEYLTVAGADPVDEIYAAAAADLDAVGLRILAPRGLALEHPVVGNRERIREIRRAVEDTGIEVLDFELVTLTADGDIVRFVPAMETAAEIGCRYVQVVSEDPDEARATANFASLCDRAGSFGMRVALEFMRWRSVRTIEDAARFVRAAGRTNGGIVLDTLHLSRSGGTPAAVASVPPEALMYVQLCDASARIPPDEDVLAEARGRRLYPGDGELWLDELLDVLPDDIAISVEVPGAIDSSHSVRDRARGAADAVRAYLARYRARAHG
jgi:sugar phosphate isomerase/epimerase